MSYRTKECFEFAKTGSCQYGDDCRFAHFNTVKKSVKNSVKIEEKKDFDEAAAVKAIRASIVSGKYKTQPCKFEKNGCKLGPIFCTYRHSEEVEGEEEEKEEEKEEEEEEEEEEEKPEKPHNANTVTCRYWKEGKCRKSDEECNFLHSDDEPVKLTICTNCRSTDHFHKDCDEPCFHCGSMDHYTFKCPKCHTCGEWGHVKSRCGECVHCKSMDHTTDTCCYVFKSPYE